MYRDNFILVPTYILSIFAWVLEKRRVKALNAHRVSKKLHFRVLKNTALYPPKKDFKSFTMNYYSPLTNQGNCPCRQDANIYFRKSVIFSRMFITYRSLHAFIAILRLLVAHVPTLSSGSDSLSLWTCVQASFKIVLSISLGSYKESSYLLRSLRPTQILSFHRTRSSAKHVPDITYYVQCPRTCFKVRVEVYRKRKHCQPPLLDSTLRSKMKSESCACVSNDTIMMNGSD